MDVERVLDELGTSPKGLGSDEVGSRLEFYGENKLLEIKKEPWIVLFLRKFTEPLILLLLVSAIVSVLIGEKADAIGIAVAVSLVAVLGFVQEYRSERSVEALKKYASHRTRVVRDGAVVEVLAEALVPGDIVVLSVGDKIPADLRLMESVDLQVDESILTGEAEPTLKTTKSLGREGLPLAEISNMAFMGTVVTNGNGRGVVTATGRLTELGRISGMIQEMADEKTPLQQKLDELGKQISLFALMVIAVIFALGVLQGRPVLEMFTVGISLAVAAIPEGLPIVVTITLALGVTRMAKRKAIVRRLPAVETLGATTIICTDKTGTLTKNEMTVQRIYTDMFVDVTGLGYGKSGAFLVDGVEIDPLQDQHLTSLLKAGVLCNNAHLNSGLIGQPTEGALLAAAFKAGIGDERETLKRTKEVPFDSEKKLMRVSYAIAGGDAHFIKGAPEWVLEECSKVMGNGETSNLTKEKRKEVLAASRSLETSALRVIALASGRDTEELTLLGLMGITDPPREGVKEAIAEVRDASVRLIMITGDSRETALAITKNLGFYEPDGLAISGQEIEEMSEAELLEKVGRINVLYRTSPEHKMKVVQALKSRGHIVAMTGDGVNDAPALKSADIGVAMGKSGTEVAKEASEMILVDDNFSTIVGAIEEGKSIYNNIRNFLRFELTTSVAAITVIAFSTLLGFPLPLNPIQILWINIIMDGPPAQSLGVEPLDRDLMKRSPRDPNDQVINRGMMFNIGLGASIMVIGTLAVFFYELNLGSMMEKRAVTMAFTTFVMFQMFNALNCRSEEKSIFWLGLFSNKYVWLAIAASVAMQLGGIYFGPLQFIFGTVPIAAVDLALVTFVAGSVFLIDEIRKKVI